MRIRTAQLNVLVISQLLAGVGVASGVAVGGLLAEQLSGTVALAGLAQTCSVLGAGLWAIPLARLAERRGRRWGLGMGYVLAIIGTLLILTSAALGTVVVLFIGLGFFGAATAAGLQARFAATDVASPAYRARAMSIVLWATTIGSIAGPNLSQLGSNLGTRIGIEPLTGPYIFSFTGFAAAALIVGIGLRPRAVDQEPEAPTDPPPRLGVLAALRLGLRNPRTVLAIVAITCSHTVMVGVMVMTPVHMHTNGFTLSLIGLVISIHIFGMYGASPVMGWLVDKTSADRVIMIGVVIFAAALILAATSNGHSMITISLALGLLGLGWSAGMIGGSTLLTESVTPEVKVSMQGGTDTVMNLAAASSSALSGLILGWGGYPALAAVAGAVLVPLVILLVRAMITRNRTRTPVTADVG